MPYLLNGIPPRAVGGRPNKLRIAQELLFILVVGPFFFLFIVSNVALYKYIFHKLLAIYM